MLAAVSKAAYRVSDPGECAAVLREAAATALTPPRGPVSVEIPADVQAAAAGVPDDVSPLPLHPAPPDEAALERLAARFAAARRPLLWLGGGARHAGAGARRLADLGVGIVTSVRGRGVVPEDHPLTLGAFNQSPDVESFYGTVGLHAGGRHAASEQRHPDVPARAPIPARAGRHRSRRPGEARLSHRRLRAGRRRRRPRRPRRPSRRRLPAGPDLRGRSAPVAGRRGGAASKRDCTV